MSLEETMTDTKVEDYGPLTGLIGTWEGDKGMDVAPEPDGTENNPYYETITFEAIGELTNAESQCLAGIHYHRLYVANQINKSFTMKRATGCGMLKPKRSCIHY